MVASGLSQALQEKRLPIANGYPDCFNYGVGRNGLGLLKPPAGMVPPGMATGISTPLSGGDRVEKAGSPQQKRHVAPRVSVSSNKAIGRPSFVPPIAVVSVGWVGWRLYGRGRCQPGYRRGRGERHLFLRSDDFDYVVRYLAAVACEGTLLPGDVPMPVEESATCLCVQHPAPSALSVITVPVAERKLTAGTGRVRGTLVVVRVALVKGEAVDCWAVVKGEADWARATIVAKGLVVSGAGRLALAAWLEPLPLPFPPRRAFPCPLSGAPWGGERLLDTLGGEARVHASSKAEPVSNCQLHAVRDHLDAAVIGTGGLFDVEVHLNGGATNGEYVGDIGWELHCSEGKRVHLYGGAAAMLDHVMLVQWEVECIVQELLVANN
eukprot:symbB.v1.2.026604.t1/scaffold2672.1/size73286/10